MVARRVWIVTISLNDGPVIAALPNPANITCVLALLQVARAPRYVADGILRLDAALTIELHDQRQDLGRRRRDGPRHHVTKDLSGKDIYVLSHPIDVRSQVSTILKLEEG